MSVIAAHRVTGVATDAESREKDDFYPTPPEATNALLDREQFDGPIWEPACGDGAISEVLKSRGYHVQSTDLVDRGYGWPRVDFLMEYTPLAPNIVTNPPYKNTAEFMKHALNLASGKVAFLLRLACLEGVERGEIYDARPPARIWVFRKRLVIWRNGIATSDSGGMIAMAWFVWDRSHSGPTQLGWI